MYEYNWQYYQNERHARHEYNEELRHNRLREQESKKDYNFDDSWNIELCLDCKTPINSDDHCPNCDY